MPLDRKYLIETIAYALWRRMDLRPKKRSLDDARIWAGKVVDHMELCGIDCEKRPPKPLHGTPDFARHDDAPER